MVELTPPVRTRLSCKINVVRFLNIVFQIYTKYWHSKNFLNLNRVDGTDVNVDEYLNGYTLNLNILYKPYHIIW